MIRRQVNIHSKRLEREFRKSGYRVKRISESKISVNGVIFNRLYPNSNNALNICTNKAVTKKILLDMGFNTPNFEVYERSEKPISLAKHLNFPLVIKPVEGSLSRDVFAGVANKSDMYFAVNTAFRGGLVMLEQYISGQKFRVLLTREKVLSAIRYTLPVLIGDGESTVLELLEKHKKATILDPWALNAQKVKETDILPIGKEVYPTYIAALSHGSYSEEMQPDIPEQLKVLPEILKGINGLYACGIDCIIDEAGKLHIIEINGNSFIRNTKLVERGLKINAFKELFEYYLLLVGKKR